MYQNLYTLIAEKIYGLGTLVEALTPEMELVATTLSTIGVVALVALPFAVVYKFVKGWF